MYHAVEQVFEKIILYSIMILEMAGVAVLLVTAIRCFVGYLRGRKYLRIDLAEGISLALLFKMGGEVLRTLIVRTWDELSILGAIMALRGALTFLLHWEIKTARQDSRTEEGTPEACAASAKRDLPRAG